MTAVLLLMPRSSGGLALQVPSDCSCGTRKQASLVSSSEGPQLRKESIDTVLNYIAGRLGLDDARVLFGRFAIPVMVRYNDLHAQAPTSSSSCLDRNSEPVAIIRYK